MKLSDTSYAVTGLGATPPWVVNAGFIVGQARTLVIDTGMNRLAAQTIFGYATAVRPENDLNVLRDAAVGLAIERMRHIIEQAIRQGQAPTVS